jgi:hypothetical protein
MSNSGNDTRAFHQGANAATFFGIFILYNYEVISGGMAFLILIAMIAFYSYRHP